MSGAKEIHTEDGRKGVFFDEPKEYQALRNWRAGRFNEAEKILAEEWRRATAAIDLESFRHSDAERLKGKRSPRSFDEIIPYVDQLLAIQSDINDCAFEGSAALEGGMPGSSPALQLMSLCVVRTVASKKT
jgi:hypothetical protein